ncbi:MAG: TetR family transcriptional regulator [Solirubrobacteraceae bacterium]|nr:TetR family transcriptional regulator [Solirubrobacteraceae bacterium]
MNPQDLPYAALLKRRPTQARSAQRVEAILDAAAELLRDREPEQIMVRDLASQASVPTGTIYQFFADRDTVLQALALRFLAAMPDVLDSVLDEPTDWPRMLDAVVDAYATMFRQHPAIRRLWLSGKLDAATRHVERETDARIAVRLGAAVQELAQTSAGEASQWRALVALIDGLLRHAFTDDATGDEQALAEAKRAARAYAGDVLGTR